MSNALKALMSSGAQEPLYSDSVFSCTLYTGNGSTQTITNGIDLAGKGGMVWTKDRTNAYAHKIVDSARANFYSLDTTSTAAQAATTAINAFNSNGYTLAADPYWNWNKSSDNYVSWTFRKAAKFFDVVTWSGNDVSGRQITHNLGLHPGMIIVKRIDTTGSWPVYHRSSGATNYYYLNTTNAVAAFSGMWNDTEPTSSAFTVGNNSNVNATGGTYVAYLFAHDTAADGIVQCGSFTTDGSGNATVNHGWTAGVQFAAIKSSSTSDDWEMFDTARTSGWSGNDARLRANLSNAEDSVARLSASGTSVSFAGLSASATYVYVFIVAPT